MVPVGLLTGAVAKQDEAEGLTHISLGGQTLRITHRPLPLGSQQRCRVYASDVSVCLSEPDDSSILNIFPATVSRIDKARLPGEVLVTAELAGGQKILAQISLHSQHRLQLEAGSRVWMQLKSVAVL